MSIRIRNIIGANNNPIANQFIIEDETNKTVTFQSYNSTIAEYNEKERTLIIHSNWDYSKTTLKYFKQFVNEYTHNIRYETKEKFLKIALENDKISFI